VQKTLTSSFLPLETMLHFLSIVLCLLNQAFAHATLNPDFSAPNVYPHRFPNQQSYFVTSMRIPHGCTPETQFAAPIPTFKVLPFYHITYWLIVFL
jgi:hypothetical protein